VALKNKGEFMAEYEVNPGYSGMETEFRDDLNNLGSLVHQANAKWWQDLKTGQPIERNKGEMLMLMVSEIAEAMEGIRKDLMDDKLPNRKMVEVELADLLIRVFDFCGGFGYDLGGSFVDKMRYNATRKDHSHEERLKPNGKKF
jgi:NTP pyrophosphatase (non-canonical NTP hydrolase)